MIFYGFLPRSARELSQVVACHARSGAWGAAKVCMRVKLAQLARSVRARVRVPCGPCGAQVAPPKSTAAFSPPMASICAKATSDRREALDVATSPPRLESSL